MSKRLQIITSYPLFNEPVIRNRLLPLIHVASSYGYEVTLISSDDKVYTKAGLEFSHLTLPDTRAKPRSFIKRFVFELKQSRRLLKTANKLDADLRIITVPSMFLLFNIHLLKSGKLIVDIRDLVWEYIPITGVINRISKIVFRYLAKLNLSKANLITATNENEIRYLKNLTHDEIKTLYVTNGVSFEQFQKLSEVSSQTNNNFEQVSVAYIGNIGLAQDLTYLVDVACSMPEIKFYIIGAGTSYLEIKEYVSAKNADNIEMPGRLPWNEVVDIYNNVDILYAQLTPDFSSAVPSKLYEYLCTGKHVIYGGMKQAESILSQFDNNIIIPPCDSQALESALNASIDNGLYKVNSESNKKNIEAHFIRENSALKVFDYFE